MFGGSGTTALASKMLGYNSIYIEKNSKYYQIAQERLSYDD